MGAAGWQVKGSSADHLSWLQCIPWDGTDPLLCLEEVKQTGQGGSLLQRGAAPHHDQLGLGAGQGHIEPAGVLQQAPSQALPIAAHKGQDDAGLVPPLALVDGQRLHHAMALLQALPCQQAHL